tara:strand:+ start:1771 stop:2289 length:519 start_codon:yes stop_codon:yes gene_type:complete
LKLAYDVSGWSKDPSTKVGAVIARDKDILGVGYNGFPSAIEDAEATLNDRALKYPRVIHGELNALKHSKVDVTGATLYTWPFQPCSACTIQMINYEVARIVAPSYEDDNPTWIESFKNADVLIKEGGIELVLPNLHEITQQFMIEDVTNYLNSPYVIDAKATMLKVLSDDHS